MGPSEADIAALDALELSVQPLTGPLLPLLIPPTPSTLPPPLPPRPDSSPFPGWRVDRFTIPAAFPRTAPGSTVSPEALAQGGGEAAQEQGVGKHNVGEVYERVMKGQVEGARRQIDVADAGEVGEQVPLWVSVNRYRPAKAEASGVGEEGQGLTLVWAHANGFHKEIWEPTMADLVARLTASGPNAPRVDELWALDSIHQGDSGVLNDGILGETFNWADNGRDILAFVINHLNSPQLLSPDAPATDVPLTPTPHDSSLLRLDNPAPPPLPPATYPPNPYPPSPIPAPSATPPPISPPSARTFGPRRIVGIGHSLGGGGLAYAASALPELFAGAIFVDPVLPPLGKSVRPLTTGALVRREEWASREEARKGFEAKAFFQAWDKRVLDKYVEFGLRDNGKGVALKAKAKHEALVFADPACHAARRAHARLTSLRADLPVHFILADLNRSVLPEIGIAALLSQVPHATHTRVKGAGHLVAQEKPGEVARAVAECLIRWFPRGRRAAKL